MKRFLALLLVLLTTAFSARAEIVGLAGDKYIHSLLAPNGKPVYFVSQEEEPFVLLKDVNFDGVEDMVVTVTLGASNFGCEFFVWHDGSYVPVRHGGADSLVNYELYPELGLVETYVDEGVAGAFHERTLWRWNGTDLQRVRTAYSQEAETWSSGDGTYTVVTNNNLVWIRVWDVVDGSSVVPPMMDVTVPLRDEQALQAAEQEELRLFWQGLRP